jgi:hypothetical protein
MKRRSVLLASSAALLSGIVPFASTAEAGPEVKITPRFFKYGGVKYFRGKAENIVLGAFGQKKTPVGGVAHLAVQDRLKPNQISRASVRMAGPFDIDWGRFKKTDVEGSVGLKYFTMGAKAGVAFSHSKAQSAKLKLLKLYMDEGPLMNALNGNPTAARDYLKREKNDGRVVHEVWVVMEAQLANHFSSATSVSVSGSGNVNGVEISASGKGSSRTQTTESITIAPGTAFAYLMIKVKKWNKTNIADLEDDLKGIG